MFKDCKYITGAVKKSQYPNNREGLPEFLFLGRSNVGKSSLINALVGRKALAHISSQPGKTRILNFFLIDNRFYLVDAPGYGYAVRSKAQRRQFGILIEEYLHVSDNLRKVFLLIDTKVGPTANDKIMYDYLCHFHFNTVIVATKSDKVAKTKLNRYRKKIAEALSLTPDELIVSSALKKNGLAAIKDIIIQQYK